MPSIWIDDEISNLLDEYKENDEDDNTILRTLLLGEGKRPEAGLN